MLDGTAMLEAPVTLTTAEAATDGVIRIDPEMSVYPVAVNGDVQITVDASQVADSKFDATLLLDCDNVGVISFPENFYWSADAPTLGSNTVHAIKLSSVGDDKYLAKVIGSIAKPATSAVTYAITIDGVTTEYDAASVYEIMSAVGSDVGHSSSSISIYSAVVNELYLSFLGEGGYSEVNIDGGDVGVIHTSSNGDANRSTAVINVSGGRLGAVVDVDDFIGPVAVHITVLGGLVDALSLPSGTSDYSLTLNGGTAGLLTAESDTAQRELRSGTIELMRIASSYFNLPACDDLVINAVQPDTEDGRIDLTVGTGVTIRNLNFGARGSGRLFMTGGVIDSIQGDAYEGYIRIDGGVVGSIALTTDHESSTMPCDIYIAGGTVSNISAVMNDKMSLTFGHRCSVQPVLRELAYVGELDITNPDDVTDLGVLTIPVGANSTLGLSKSTQAFVAAGNVVINADPTATIINL